MQLCPSSFHSTQLQRKVVAGEKLIACSVDFSWQGHVLCHVHSCRRPSRCVNSAWPAVQPVLLLDPCHIRHFKGSGQGFG